MSDTTQVRERVKRLVSNTVWELMDFPVKHNISNVSLDAVLTDNAYGIDNLAYTSLLDYLSNDGDLYDVCNGLTLSELIELLESSDMYIEVG